MKGRHGIETVVQGKAVGILVYKMRAVEIVQVRDVVDQIRKILSGEWCRCGGISAFDPRMRFVGPLRWKQMKMTNLSGLFVRARRWKSSLVCLMNNVLGLIFV